MTEQACGGSCEPGGGRKADWLVFQRPRSYWDVVGRHLPLFLPASAALLLAAWQPLERLPLVPCLFLEFSGRPCPFCGYTRSFWAMAQGEWRWAIYNAPLAVVLYLAAFLTAAFNAAALLSGRIINRGRRLRLSAAWQRSLTAGVILLILLQWVYRLVLNMT